MTTCPSGVNYMHLVDHARHAHRKNLQTRRMARPRALRRRAGHRGLATPLSFPARIAWRRAFGKIVR